LLLLLFREEVQRAMVGSEVGAAVDGGDVLNDVWWVYVCLRAVGM
jgi:hypothetical protein